MDMMTNPFEIILKKQERLERQIEQLMNIVSKQYSESGDLDKSKLATRKDAAHYLGVSIATIDNLVRSRQLNPTRVGASVRFKWDALDEFVNKRS